MSACPRAIGAAGLLLALLEVDLDRLRNAVLVELGGVRR